MDLFNSFRERIADFFSIFSIIFDKEGEKIDDGKAFRDLILDNASIKEGFSKPKKHFSSSCVDLVRFINLIRYK